MPNSIERDVYVLRDTLKNPISYVRGTDLLPIILHFRDFTIPSGATAKVFVAKNDGNAVYGGATITGNDVTVDVTQQMFITLGVNLMQVEIDSGNETLVTFEQPVMVTPNLKAGDLPESTTDIEFLDEAIEQAQEAVKDAQQAIADANTAISGANTAASSANAAAENANQAAEDLQDKVDAGDFTASVQVGTTTTLEPDQDATVSNSGTNKDAVLNFGIPKGDPGTAASIQVGTTQTVQPESNAEVTNSGTANAAVLNFKIPRGEDGMTDLTAEYKDASEYTCQPTVNAPVVVKELDGKTEQGENPTPDNPQVIKGVGGMGYFDGILQQGYHNINGSVANSPGYVSNLNKIYCKENDIISIFIEDKNETDFAFLFFDNSGKYIQKIIEKTCTAPANSKYMYFRYKIENLTPQTAGYISVTVNGEYQTGVETTGKNLCPPVSEWIYNSLQNRYETKIFLKGGKKYYASSNIPEPSGNQFVYYFLNTGNAVSKNYTKTYTPQKDEYIDMYAYMGRAYSEDALKGTYYIQVEEGESPTDYTPYHHTAISIPLTSPLYEGDKICYVKPGESYVDAEGDTVVADRILYGCYRENAVVVFDGSEDESLGKNSGGDNLFSCTITNKAGSSVGGEQNLKCNKLTTAITNSSVSDMPDNSIKENGTIGSNILFFNISEAGTTVESLRAWLSTNPLTVVYRLAQPYFEPFTDQSIFYDLRTDDILTYIYSSDPIEPNVTVEVAKNSTGGYLLESYAQAQKNAISEANSQSRISAIEQQLVNQATTPTE